MGSFDTEIAAARARVAEIERKLSDVVATIQSEANNRIVDATRRAMTDIIPLRTFIASVGSDSSASDPNGGMGRIEAGPPFISTQPSGRRPTTKSMNRSKDLPTETAKIALLRILSEALDPMGAADLDQAVVDRGFKKTSGQKERKKTRDEGLTQLLEDGKLSITEQGRILLHSKDTAG